MSQLSKFTKTGLMIGTAVAFPAYGYFSFQKITKNTQRNYKSSMAPRYELDERGQLRNKVTGYSVPEAYPDLNVHQNFTQREMIKVLLEAREQNKTTLFARSLKKMALAYKEDFNRTDDLNILLAGKHWISQFDQNSLAEIFSSLVAMGYNVNRSDEDRELLVRLAESTILSSKMELMTLFSVLNAFSKCELKWSDLSPKAQTALFKRMDAMHSDCVDFEYLHMLKRLGDLDLSWNDIPEELREKFESKAVSILALEYSPTSVSYTMDLFHVFGQLQYIAQPDSDIFYGICWKTIEIIQAAIKNKSNDPRHYKNLEPLFTSLAALGVKYAHWPSELCLEVELLAERKLEKLDAHNIASFIYSLSSMEMDWTKFSPAARASIQNNLIAFISKQSVQLNYMVTDSLHALELMGTTFMELGAEAKAALEKVVMNNMQRNTCQQAAETMLSLSKICSDFEQLSPETQSTILNTQHMLMTKMHPNDVAVSLQGLANMKVQYKQMPSMYQQMMTDIVSKSMPKMEKKSLSDTVMSLSKLGVEHHTQPHFFKKQLNVSLMNQFSGMSHEELYNTMEGMEGIKINYDKLPAKLQEIIENIVKQIK